MRISEFLNSIQISTFHKWMSIFQIQVSVFEIHNYFFLKKYLEIKCKYLLIELLYL